MSLFERILVPTDMSGFSDRALQYALHFSERLGSQLTLLHAKKISWLATEHPFGYYLENSPEEKVALIRKLAAYAAAHAPATSPLTTLFADDSPEGAIPRIARVLPADLIIMGTHGRHGIRRALLGSVTAHVLRETETPVLTVNPSLFASPVGIRTVLCPVSLTGTARAALEQASAIAEAFAAELVVLHICEGAEPRLFSDLRDELGRWVAPSLRAGTRYKEVVAHGDAAGQILGAADHVDADLVVIGAHPRRAGNAALGRTAVRIAQFPNRPVMTVVATPAAARAAQVA
jgi:nucleotide-binding universal stress UspA family protein